MNNLIKKLYQYHQEHPESELMQGKIFHRMCLVIMITIPLALLINLFTQLAFTSQILGLAFVLIAALYYNSRYLGQLKLSIILFSIILHVLLVINYFYNSGIEGPSLILFLISLIFIIAVIPSDRYKYWIPFNLGIALFLMALDYQQPSLVGNSYHSRHSYFTDTAFTYFAAVCCITFILAYIIRSYEQERNKTVLALKELKTANAGKTKLLSILSHDLKAPLNSIQGFLEVLLQYDLTEEEKSSIKATLLAETKNTQEMLVNMLSWTKAQMDGGIKAELVPLPLLETLMPSIAIQQVAAMEKMITINISIAHDLVLLADAEMIKLVVRNLLNNAIKFTRHGGEISITAKTAGGNCLLSITDNGIGIPLAKQAGLFQLDSGTTYGTDNEKGVGLGLKLCKEFIELQRGSISFSSRPGLGTTFELSLALAGANTSSSTRALDQGRVAQ